LGYPATLFLPT